MQQAVCVRRKKIEKKCTKKSSPPKTHHEIYSSTATATTSRRRPTKHAPRLSPYSPASIDPGFVEIGLVQLSQSVKTTNVTHTHTELTDTQDRNRRTDKLNNCTLYAPRYEEAFLPIGKNGLGRFAPSDLPHYNVSFHIISYIHISNK